MPAAGAAVQAIGASVVDSHCHLQTFEPAECRRVLDRARQSGVAGFLAPAITLDDADRLLELAHSEPDVWCALGVHPHEARTWRRGHGRRLEKLLRDPKVVAVGECGLDFHYDLSPRDTQVAVMREQWSIALALELPVIVHNRDSDDAMIAALGDPQLTGLTGVFHSFAGDPALAETVLGRGLHLGVSGMVTFGRADNVRRIVRLTPLDRLLLETDTPYLAPVPFRGEPSEPRHVLEVGRRVARELDSTPSDICARTTENFFALFRRARPA